MQKISFSILSWVGLWIGSALAQEPCVLRQELTARSMGIIHKILVKDGSSVKKGQPILEFDSRLLQAGLKEAQGALEAAKANESLAQDTEARLQKLRSGDTVTEKQMVESRHHILQAQAARKQAEGAVERVQVQLEDTVIRAEIPGTVRGLPMVLGLFVQVGQSLGRIDGDPAACKP